MNPRSEPLLWLQLIAVGVLPLEALLLLLLLAGSDPGPVPALERLLCWGIGGLLPALVLWRRPADVWSLLVLQAPLRARRPLQQRLSALQEAIAVRIGLVGGSALLLALLWWSDDHAAMAGSLSPLAASPRLVGLLLSALVLALMLWQWQQLLQSLWLLSRSPGTIAAATPMGSQELEARRLCLGLPLLLMDPLAEMAGPSPSESRPPKPRQPKVARSTLSPPDPTIEEAAPAEASSLPGPETGAGSGSVAAPQGPVINGVDPSPELAAAGEPGPAEASVPDGLGTDSHLLNVGSGGPTADEAPTVAPSIQAGTPAGAQLDPATGDAQPLDSAVVPVAVEPEQGAEDGEGGHLDQQIG